MFQGLSKQHLKQLHKSGKEFMGQLQFQTIAW